MKLVEAGVEPSLAMSEKQYELLMAGYLASYSTTEATRRQQLAMAYHRAAESWASARSLSQIRRDWAKVFDKLATLGEFALLSTGPGGSRYQDELELYLCAQIHRVLLVLHQEICRAVNASETSSDKRELARKLCGTLRTDRRAFEEWSNKRGLRNGLVLLGLIDGFLSYWQQRQSEYRGQEMGLQRKATKAGPRQNEPRVTKKQELRDAVAQEILRILRTHRGEVFTADELASMLSHLVPDVAGMIASHRRATISQAVTSLRKEGHPIPPYRYTLPAESKS